MSKSHTSISRAAISQAIANGLAQRPDSRSRGYRDAVLGNAWSCTDADTLLDYSLGYADGEIARLMGERAPAIPETRQ